MSDNDTGPDTNTAPDTTAITTRTKDYVGRVLSNIAVDARDHLGRATAAGDKDFLGRALVA